MSLRFLLHMPLLMRACRRACTKMFERCKHSSDAAHACLTTFVSMSAMCSSPCGPSSSLRSSINCIRTQDWLDAGRRREENELYC